MLKKFKILILTLTLILISSITCFAQTTQYQRANALVEKGWIKGRNPNSSDLDLDENLTRAEVARIVCAIKNLDNTADFASDAQSQFKDVYKGTWANGFIIVSSRYGYISGYPNRIFKPNKNITYEELISILVRIDKDWKNYSTNEAGGNWARKFIDIADNKGLLQDCDISSYTDLATRGNTFTIIYNMNKNDYGRIKSSYKPNINNNNNSNSNSNNNSNSNSNSNSNNNSNNINNQIQNTNSQKNEEKKNFKFENYTIDTSSGNKVVRGKLLDYEDKLFELINKEREKHNLEPYVKGDSVLSDLAEKRAVEIAYSYSHTRPNGQSPLTTIMRNGSFTAGENIAYGQSSPEDVIKSWMNSPGHRANILNPSFKSVSQKAFVNEKNTLYWVQVFASKSGNNNTNNSYNQNSTNYNKNNNSCNQNNNNYNQNNNSCNQSNNNYNQNNNSYNQNNNNYNQNRYQEYVKKDPDEGKYQTYTIETSSGTEQIEGYYPTQEDDMLYYVNKERESRGISPLKKAYGITSDFAKIRARELANKFSHTRPSGKTVLVKFSDGFAVVGENAAYGSTTAKDTIQQLMDSPGHKRNILNPSFQYVGQSAFKDKNTKQTYWIQVFTVKLNSPYDFYSYPSYEDGNSNDIDQNSKQDYEDKKEEEQQQQQEPEQEQQQETTKQDESKNDENYGENINDDENSQTEQRDISKTTLYVYMQKLKQGDPQKPLYTFKGVTTNFRVNLSSFLNPNYVDVENFDYWDIERGNAYIMNSRNKDAILNITSTVTPVKIRAYFK